MAVVHRTAQSRARAGGSTRKSVDAERDRRLARIVVDEIPLSGAKEDQGVLAGVMMAAVASPADQVVIRDLDNTLHTMSGDAAAQRLAKYLTEVQRIYRVAWSMKDAGPPIDIENDKHWEMPA